MTNSKATEEALREAHSAFDQGNYALVRKRALPLLESDNAAIQEAARILLAQIAPAPVGKYLFLLTALLLLAVTYFAYSK